MKTTTRPDDVLDALLSDFFKSEMTSPWPAAPTAAHSEPSLLAAARNRPAAAGDHGARARYTLAASVALLLGTCWALSSGFQAGGRAGTPGPRTGPAFDMNPATADGTDTLPGVLKKEADKGNNNVFVPPKIDLP